MQSDSWVDHPRVRGMLIPLLAVLFFLSSMIVAYQFGSEDGNPLTGFATVDEIQPNEPADEYIVNRGGGLVIEHVVVPHPFDDGATVFVEFMYTGTEDIADLIVATKMVRVDTGEVIATSADVFKVQADSSGVWDIDLDPDGYVGEVELTALVHYGKVVPYSILSKSLLIREHPEPPVLEERVDSLEEEPIDFPAPPPSGPVLWTILLILIVAVVFMMISQTKLIKKRINLGKFIAKEKDTVEHSQEKKYRKELFEKKIEDIQKRLK